MKAIKLKLENFKLASEILKKDKNFIMQIIEVNPKILKYIHVNFRNHIVNKDLHILELTKDPFFLLSRQVKIQCLLLTQ